MRFRARVAALGGSLALTAVAVQAFQVDIGAETIVMSGQYDKPATFPHRRHQAWYGCSACHHVKDQSMTIDKCGACHEGAVKNSQVDSVRKAAHQLCKECHSREREKGRPAPSSCSVCHPRPGAAE